ncbi:MAG TPA: hypothetical protein VFB84_01215 [Micromonosporaceae bacterium]|nr:hypothetical protein [Micromonosporaceae bacterium]
MPLEFLADRDVGKRVVAALRGAGEIVHTLADVYGEEQSQQTEDPIWIAKAGAQRWAALTKNKKIRYVTRERDAVAEHAVWLFALANGNLGFAEMADALLAAMPRVHEICAEHPGGAIWIAHRNGRVDQQWP